MFSQETLETFPSRLWPVALVYAAMSLITLAAFALDKSRARRGRRRVPESALHTLELLGGWPGAMVGSQIFRHKRMNVRYEIVLWLIAAGHVGFWLWWF